MTDLMVSPSGPGWKHLGYMKGADLMPVSGQVWVTAETSEAATSVAVGSDEQDSDGPLKCPHCSRDWHPEPLTHAVVEMLAYHKFRLDYDPASDDSEIVCIGAEYHGPNRPTTHYNFYGGTVSGYIAKVYQQIQSTWNELSTILWLDEWKPMGYLGQSNGYFQILPKKPDPCELPDDLPTVEFGPQNWIPLPPKKHGVKLHTDTVANLNPELQQNVLAYWDDFTNQDFPVPERPGLDFSQYETDEISYPTNGKKEWK